jgi:hypothetical protein
LHDGRVPEPIRGLERTQAIDDGGARPGSIDDGVTLPNRGDPSLGEGDDEPSQDAAEPGQLRRGDAIGRFVTLDLLGVGGMGEVYLCYDPELDRRVAVKLLHPPRSGRAEEARARLLREARSIARLSHPNVVTVHDVAVWQDRVFLAMEYVAGPTLAVWGRAHVGDWAAVVATATSSSRLAASPQKPPFPRNAVDLQQSGLLRGRRFAQEWSEVVRMAQSWPKFEARSWGPCAPVSEAHAASGRSVTAWAGAW